MANVFTVYSSVRGGCSFAPSISTKREAQRSTNGLGCECAMLMCGCVRVSYTFNNNSTNKRET